MNIDWNNFDSTLVIEVTRPAGKYTCSGVAINNSTVLTAAHCLEGEILNIRVFNQATYNPKSESWSAESFELHPNYNKEKSNFNADLARIKLSSKLPETLNYYPVLKNKNDLQGRFLRVGYGERNNTNTRTLVTPALKDSSFDILELNDMYSFSGDSGGPVFIQNNGQMYLAAIHSTLSYGPEGRYSYNPLLSQYREWIYQN